MTKRAIFIVHRTQPGARASVQAVWERHMRPAIAANPGHLAYHYGFDAADPDVIRVFQLYSDPSAAVAFLASAAYTAYLADVEPLLMGPPEVTAADEVWAKG